MSWPTVALGEVASVERRSVQPEDLAADTWYVGLEHIESGGQIVGRQQAGVAGLKSPKFLFDSQHVLYGKLRPYLAKIAVPDFDGVCSTDILPVRPGPVLNRLYLTYYLRKSEIVDLANSRASGANLPRLSPSELEKLPIPLPPLEEQRRIAAILDRADAIRAKRNAVGRLISVLAQSLFREKFGSPDEWEGSWPNTTIGDLAESVQYGTSARAASVGAWPVLRMGNLKDDAHLDLTDLKYLDLAESDVEKYTVRSGDLLFNRTNSRDKVVKSCAVHTDRKLAFAGYLIRVRFQEAVWADYVATFLTSSYGRALRYGMAKSAVNQANISASEMRSIRLPNPPLSLIQEFSHELSVVRLRESEVVRAGLADDSLFASLQSRAFKGEL